LPIHIKIIDLTTLETLKLFLKFTYLKCTKNKLKKVINKEYLVGNIFDDLYNYNFNNKWCVSVWKIK
jgi:hypothetical protein